MCRTKTQGGVRCATSATVNSRRVVAQRLKRHTIAGKTGLAAQDATVLAGLDAARDLYGPVVTPMTMDLPASVHDVFAALRRARFRPLVVGGSVRDALSDGRAPKDVDIEVYGATIDQTARVLRGVGYRVDEVGKAFGVLKVVLLDGTDLDVSVPRRDNHVGAGHRGFTVETDTNMTAEEAAARRDFTINAMGFDPEHNVCVDPYHGREDLDAGILRATSDAFAEDPLRVLRGFQFAARYNMAPDEETAAICRALATRADELPVERVRGEWEKFYTKGTHHGHALAVLADVGWDTTVPGLAAHNTELVRRQVQYAGQVAGEDNLDDAARIRLLAATVARRMTNPENQRAFITHTIEGGDQQRAALGLARAPYPAIPQDDTSIRAWAHRLGEGRTTVREWARLEKATENPPMAASLLAQAEALGCAEGPQPDLILGRDIIARFADRRPGPWTGTVQRAARQAQVDGEFSTRTEAEMWLRSYDPPE